MACALIILKQYSKRKHQILEISIGKIPLGFWSARERLTEAEAREILRGK
jgi:hypothetical protein